MTTTRKDEKAGVKSEDPRWVRTLYERYVQLYGDPIEQPIPEKTTDMTPAGDQHPG